jgi:hypothetical protein
MFCKHKFNFSGIKVTNRKNQVLSKEKFFKQFHIYLQRKTQQDENKSEIVR